MEWSWSRRIAGRSKRLFSTNSHALLSTAFGSIPNSAKQHLKWMRQKQLLKQDVLLLGPPPSQYTRRLALEFAHLANLPVEVVSLTPDTTESDLKTRRDLVKQTVTFSDQAPVRAALGGKMLILDGLEKCERNVLPTLNNLLENREMNLDDGRLIVSYARYQYLLKTTSEEVLRKSGIVSAHPNFFVVALTSPTPPYSGRPLDPPLRSRFQVRRVDFPHAGELLELGVDQTAVGISASLNAACDSNPKLIPRFPDWNVLHIARLLKQKSSAPSLESVFSRNYPWLKPELNHAQRKAFLKLFEASSRKQKPGQMLNPFSTTSYMPKDKREILTALLEDHTIGRDVLICGPPGSGKTFLAQQFANELKRPVVVFPLHRDMTSRDLIARRTTDVNTGDTTWEPSPLVKAAQYGHFLVLDGVEKVEYALLAVARLFQDRELEFIDGVKIQLSPHFRVVALANAVGSADKRNAYGFLSPEMLSMFSCHVLPSTKSSAELLDLVAHEHPSAPKEMLEKLIKLATLLETKGKEAGLGALSLRSLFRVAKRLEVFPNERLMVSQIKRGLLEPFLPQTQRELLKKLLAEVNILDGQVRAAKRNAADEEKTAIHTTENEVNIGDVRYTRFPKRSRPDLVPKVVFFDVAHHRRTLQEMLIDFVTGFRHLVLIGNQGVGKNKLADRMLELLNAEREYVQLHRDSTVAGLTGAPTIQDGRVVWEDSPLVRAAKYGRVLVVDEADKAPPEVIAVLKSLVEDGDMLLGNGKRLVREKSAVGHEDEIAIHPDFCVWILSNRPGFPFHGNDFFKQIGDVFATHIVENPDLHSEFELLRSYAPTTDSQTLLTLARCFSDLRGLADEGVITYPYSTREAVNVARHLEAFPEDGLVHALHNVLDFDSFQPEVAKLLSKVFQKHGVPFVFESTVSRTSLGADMGLVQPLPELKPSGEVWRFK